MKSFKDKMIKKIINFHAIMFLLMIIPFSIVSGQDKKTEQRIKIVVAGGDGKDVLLDTIINGTPRSDSITLKDGNTIYLAELPSDSLAPGRERRFIVSTTSAGKDEGGKEVSRKITVISSDSDNGEISGKEKSGKMTWVSAESGDRYTFTDEDNRDTESTKYVIHRDGISVTVEGSDYARVKEIVKEIENTLDSKAATRQK